MGGILQEMSQQELIARISAHRIASTIPPEEISWLAANTEFRKLETGQILTSKAAGYVEGLFLILSGRLALHVDRPNGREKVMEWTTGDVAGLLPYSRLTVPPGDSSAQEPTEIVVLHRDRMRDLIQHCHAFTAALVHAMVDRAKHFTSTDLHAEKMASLGKLSAGLAHELNNPAAAIARSAGSLKYAIAATENASHAVGALGLSPSQTAVIDEVRKRVLRCDLQITRSPIEQAEREADIEDWLVSRQLDLNDSATLAETSLEIGMLEELAAALPHSHLGTVLHWLAAGCLTRQLAHEAEAAASRISTLVDAVKGFTHMDQNATAGPVDIEQGLSQTLAIHGSKAREKGIAIRVEIDPGLGKAHGIAGELNQVWSNLLDNALDALGKAGVVTIQVSAQGGQLVVSFTDNGPGIPPEVKSRIFDPFFTTKPVGKGTGLGLDIVKRIVQKHKGRIEVESRPGRTQFRVTLPVAAQEARA